MIAARGAGSSGGFRSVSYNPAENAVLLTTDHDGGSYELFSIPKDANGSSVVRPFTPWHCNWGMLHYRFTLQRPLQ